MLGIVPYAGAEAGQAFEKLAQVHLKQDSRLEAASSYVDAAKCYQKTSKTGVPVSRSILWTKWLQHTSTLRAHHINMLTYLCCADVLRALHNAVEFYTEAGRLGMAAKQLRVWFTS